MDRTPPFPIRRIGRTRTPQGPPPGDGGADPGQDPDTVDQEAPRRLHCARCGRWITLATWMIALHGDPVHTFTNPAGETFEIGLFREAPGARAEGASSGLHTWFPGYVWRVARCGGCGVQLGWHYTGTEPPRAFHGLILDRLTERSRTD
ncbi:MAG: hypothetical protein KDE22_19310 [Rhodobacterales bacterium]|nr:hypothetical protein [Rhodobacterales bacterium]